MNFSLALCLEDSIDDDAVEKGEETIIETLKIYPNQDKLPYIPKFLSDTLSERFYALHA